MSKKSGISRTLKYGALYAEKVFGMIFIMIGMYALIFYLQGGIGESNAKSLMVPFYLGQICLIMLFVMQIMNNSRYIPISISFGSLRKETFIGIQWINFILIAQSVILFGGYLILSKSISDEMVSLIILLFSLMLIFLGGLGQLTGAMSIKFGKLGGFLIAGLIFILIISAIAALAFVGEMSVDIITQDILQINKIIAIFVAVLVYLCGSYVNYRVLQNYEVRA